MSVSHRLNESLSLNCLNSSVSSFSTAVITRGKRLVVLDAGVLLVRVLLGVLVGRVGRDSCRDVLGDQLVHAVRVGPRDVAELIVEGLEDVGEPIELRLGLAPAAAWSAPARSPRPRREAAICIAAFFSTR